MSQSLCLLANANWDILLRKLSDASSDSFGSDIGWQAAPFGQYRLLLADDSSELRRARHDYWLFADRLEDFVQPFETIDSSLMPQIRARFADYLAEIRRCRALLEGLFLINDFAAVRPHLATVAEQTGAAPGIVTLLAEMNAGLVALANELPDTQIVPLSSVVAELGRKACDPGKYWLIGRVPFARAFAEPYARLVAGILLAKTGRTARALAIDLDNTLWGGVVGDDGVENLKLGDDHPGNQFATLQGVIRALARRGLVLTLVSKNTEQVALDAIRTHSAMVLKDKDFVAWRINWDSKAANIEALARELDLAPSSFLFIDDNPVERAEVAGAGLGTIVPDLPADPSEWAAHLMHHPALTALALSKEDLNRSKSYEVRRDIRSAAAKPGGREAFLQGLGLKLELCDLDAATQFRINQLFAKTNQYNTTSKRYSESDLKGLSAAGHDVVALRITDKQGSDELAGAMVIRYDGTGGKSGNDRTCSIDNFVMSCRLLGRGLETAALSAVCKRALAHGCATLTGAIVETPRNEPCRTLYADHGFSPAKNGAYTLDLARPVPQPPWFEIRT